MKRDDENDNEESAAQQIDIKIEDDILKGVYSNNLFVTHTKEEFVLDFINLFPPTGIVTSRVIVTPSHLKRIGKIVEDNIRSYEEQFGIIPEGNATAHSGDSGTGGSIIN